MTDMPTASIAQRVARIVVLAALLASAILVPSGSVAAQGGVQTVEVWGIDSGDKTWRYLQSDVDGDLGSASAAALGLDDSTWTTKTLRWREIVGSNNANHFRKTFDLRSVLPAGVDPSQIVGIRVQLQYDDTAVMYLNGVEVYRSIRGNLDPDYDPYAAGADIPYDVNVPWGGAELDYINIPDPSAVNTCEIPDEECSASPYGSAQPPEIPVNLLIDGDNTWAVTTWNNSAGGSGDSSLDHVFELLIDENAIAPPQVVINETMASNDGSFEIDADGDGDLDTPDWFELHNIDPNDPTDISGWTISDSTASWVFPAGTVVPAGGYLIVLADDGDDPTADPLRTNFKLGSTGDSLKLTTPEGVVADEYVWTDQFTDNSFGRVNDTGDPTYLAAPTPRGPADELGATNDVAALTQAPPVLRFFRDRMFNPGEVVDLQLDAFDPDGDPLTFAVAPLPDGVLFDTDTGVFSGTFDHATDLVSNITVTDGDNDTDTGSFTWFAVPAPVGAASPLVLNEYNAVPATGELNGGSPVGNGGDWFEFLVVEDDVDLRGWSIEMRQRDSGNDQLRIQTIATFGDRIELAKVPAGTIITVGELLVDDLSFDADTDWSINLQIDNDGNGTFFEPAALGDVFNSTRRDQTVLIRNAAGDVVTPLSGETDAWDAANGGVSEGEVMNLCRDVVAGDTIAPVTDYRDNGSVSTFGEPNVCVFPDPLDPAQLVTDPQDLTALRASASLGEFGGDVNCDFTTNIIDALLIAQLTVQVVADTGPCLLDQGGPGHEAAELAGDFNRDGDTNIIDALVIARCTVGIASEFCPDV